MFKANDGNRCVDNLQSGARGKSGLQLPAQANGLYNGLKMDLSPDNKDNIVINTHFYFKNTIIYTLNTIFMIINIIWIIYIDKYK
jgi:hypothetical protein